MKLEHIAFNADFHGAKIPHKSPPLSVAKDHATALQPRDGDGILVEGRCSQDRVVTAALEGDTPLSVLYLHHARGFHEAPVELLGCRLLEALEPLTQPAVTAVGQD